MNNRKLVSAAAAQEAAEAANGHTVRGALTRNSRSMGGLGRTPSMGRLVEEPEARRSKAPVDVGDLSRVKPVMAVKSFAAIFNAAAAAEVGGPPQDGGRPGAAWDVGMSRVSTVFSNRVRRLPFA